MLLAVVGFKQKGWVLLAAVGLTEGGGGGGGGHSLCDGYVDE